MKRIVLLIVLGLILLNPLVTSANEEIYYMSISDKVEVKNEAMSSSETIGMIDKGIKLEVVNIVKNEFDEIWYEISYKDKLAWVYSGNFIEVEEINQNFEESIELLPNENDNGDPNLVELAKTGKTSSNIDIHRGAGKTYESIMELNAGQLVDIVAEFTNSFNELWYQVEVDGISGWILALEIEVILDESESDQLSDETDSISPDNEKLSGDIETPTSGTVSHEAQLRKGATDSYELIMELKLGQSVEVIGHFTNSVQELWYRIDINGVIGWVSAKNIETKTKEDTEEEQSEESTSEDIESLEVSAFNNEQMLKMQNNNQIPVRKGAASSYEIAFNIDKVGSYQVVALFTNVNNELWYRIINGNKLGWVKAERIWEEDSNINLDFITNSYTIVRKGATTFYDSIRVISQNETVRVVDTFVNNLGDRWYRILKEGQYGWIHAGHVDTSIPLPTNVNNRMLPIRKGATSSYEIVTYLNNEDSIRVLDFFTNANYELWYRISHKNSVGWINSSNIWDGNNNIEMLMTTIESSVIRSGATTLYGSVRSITRNETVNVIDSFVNFLGEKWYRVRYDGSIGWMHSSVVNQNVPSPMKITSIPIRKGAASSYDVVSYLETSATVEVIGQFITVTNELWYRISSKGTIGWVKAEDIWHVSNNVNLIMTFVNNKEGVIRKGASTSYEIVRTINHSEKLTIVDTFTNQSNGRWYRAFSNGEYGWLHESAVNNLVQSNFNYPNMFTNANNVNVRRGASIYEKSVLELGFNEEIKIIDLFVNSLGEVWYRAEFSPSLKGWIKADYLEFEMIKNRRYTNFDITLEESLNIQMGQLQLTDAPTSEAYISSSYVEIIGNGVITGNPVNLRTEPHFNDNVVFTVPKGTNVEVIEEVTGALYQGSTVWYKIIYNNQTLYVHHSLASNTMIGKTTTNVNVRSEPDAESFNYITLPKGTVLNIIERGSNWHKISLSGYWRNAREDEVTMYLNPENNDEFQHLVLSESVGVSKEQLNNILLGKGIFEGRGQAFIDGAKLHSVNEIYLMSHAFLETGHGKDILANGSIEVGIVDTNKWVSFQPNGNTYIAEYKYNSSTKNWYWNVTQDNNFNRNNATNIKKTYNMFGIGAYDGNAKTLGSVRAYREKWFSADVAIIGGAKFIGERYIHNQYNQNTLYKMRWNPANPGYPQYATDIRWAIKQVNNIKSVYDMLINPVLAFDIIRYK